MTAAGWVAILLLAAADDPVAVARIDDETLTQAELAEFVLGERAGAPEAEEALTQTIQEAVVRLESGRRGLHLDPAQVEARMQELERKLRASGATGLRDSLQQQGVDEAEFRRLLGMSLLCEQMVRSDFGLPTAEVLPPEKLNLWFQEQLLRRPLTREGLPPGVAVRVDQEDVRREDWGLQLFRSLAPDERDRLLEEFIATRLILRQARSQGLEVTPELIERELADRDRALREKLAGEGLQSAGVTYLDALQAGGQDPEAHVAGERFRAEALLREMARRRFGEDGWRRFHDERRDRLDARYGRKVQAATIFLRVGPDSRDVATAQAELGDLRRRLEEAREPIGPHLARLARMYSEHETAEDGGALGTLSRAGADSLGLGAALFEAEAGTLVGPVVTEDGAHLLYVARFQPAPALEEIQDELAREAHRELLQELREAADIERFW